MRIYAKFSEIHNVEVNVSHVGSFHMPDLLKIPGAEITVIKCNKFNITKDNKYNPKIVGDLIKHMNYRWHRVKVKLCIPGTRCTLTYSSERLMASEVKALGLEPIESAILKEEQYAMFGAISGG
jgi:hypothetical protein